MKTEEEINQSRQEHIKLYEGVYARSVDDNGQSIGHYGSTNHGSPLASMLAFEKPESIVDVGCGKLQFLEQMRDMCPSIDFMLGVDPFYNEVQAISQSDKITTVKGIAQDLPLMPSSYEWLTCFDVLEHIPEFDLEACIKEFVRVASKGIMMSISTRDSVIHINGQTLHATVKPTRWWMDNLLDMWLPPSVQVFHIENKGTYFNVGFRL